MPPRSRTVSATRSYGQATHELIIEAARKLFATHGFEAVSMHDIAEAAGVSRATVFNQFGAKHQIIDEMTAQTLRSYLGLLTEALEDETSSTADLVTGLFDTMTARLQRGRRLYKDIFPEIQKLTRDPTIGGQTGDLRQQCQASVRQLFARGQARGEITQKSSAENLATAFDSLLYGGVTQWLARPGNQSLETILKDMRDIFLRGARAGD